MKHIEVVMLSALSLFLVAACGHQRATPAADGRQAMTMDQPLTDAQIAAILDVANRGEIEQAEIARERATQDSVRGFASAMITGHGAAAREQSQILEQRGIRPEFNPIADQLMDQSMQIQERLRGLEGEAFDRAYMEAQLQQHRELLRMLDEELIPNAQDPQYRLFLDQLRTDIQSHLTNAERIQRELVG